MYSRAFRKIQNNDRLATVRSTGRRSARLAKVHWSVTLLRQVECGRTVIGKQVKLPKDTTDNFLECWEPNNDPQKPRYWIHIKLIVK
jgi:hypothetical protein